MLPAIVVFAYLLVVLYVGIFALRRRTTGREEFFVANRGLGTFVFLLSLFGSNMTSFAILGSSGLAMRQGIGVYGLMASISGIVIPLSIFFIGTRLWAYGKRFGHITQVQMLRDRFEMGHIGTVLFALQAVMLVPYIIIGVMGGGETLEGVSRGAVPYWLGGAIVAGVVMSYVFFGGMRGTAWVNTIQTLMFLTFGTLAFIVIARGMGGLGNHVKALAQTLPQHVLDHPSFFADAATAEGPPPDGQLLTRQRVQFWYYLSYMFIPLSSIMFPHIAIFCLTANKLTSFKKTVIFYPLCIAAIWAPAVLLGALSGGQPHIVADLAMESGEARAWVQSVQRHGAAASHDDHRIHRALMSSKDPAAAAFLADIAAAPVSTDQGATGLDVTTMTLHGQHLGDRLAQINDRALRAELRRLAGTNADGVMLVLLNNYAPWFLAGLLGAAIMACVMASDSQILALSTMFSEDIFAFYGHTRRFGETAQVWSARVFVVALTLVAYLIAILVHQYANIFELAIQFAFSGYASLAPIMLAALFWKRATKWGVLASTLWVAAALAFTGVLQFATHDIAPATPGRMHPITHLWGLPLTLGDTVLFYRETTRVSFTELRFLIVLPMFIGAALLMGIVSLLTPAPSRGTLERYFPPHAQA